MKTYKTLLTRILALVLICAMVLPFAACRKEPDVQTDPSTDPSAVKQTYTVKVESAGGIPLKGVGVYIYEDDTMQELVWFDQTGEDGTMSFADVERNSYVAVLADVPVGYQWEKMYPLTGLSTVITLAQGELDEDNIQDLTYKLGDLVMDFTVTDEQGNSYTLSELLKQKKAVVLNFWYIECAPCNMEFPFLQEAYEQYKDQIEVLALNPINQAADVEAFRTEKGYSFPMVACENSWEKLFGVAAYPTTIVIDRFGNIALKHTGTIDDAKTFTDAFGFFTAEDYTAQVVDDIKSLETEAEEGTAENPTEVGGQSSFQITVDPGKEVYTEIYKAKNMYMSIRGENKNFYVLYNNKTYRPDSSNTVGFVISTGDNYTPALFAIGNEADKTQKFQVNLSHLAGSFNNPYDLPMGEFTAKVPSGSDKGIYYRGTAPEDGTFTVQCIEAPAGVKYDFSLQSLDVNKTVLRNYQGDGTTDEATGYPTVTLPMSKGVGIMFSVGTLPDDSNSYPGGTFRFLVSFQAGELEEEEKEEKLDYTVTITDPEGQPVKDVTVWISRENETFSAVTDEQGMVTMNLVKGTYTGSIRIPEGFTLENNAFELTPEAPAATLQLAAVVDTRVDYTVTVLDIFDTAVEGIEVLVIGVGSALTDAEGKVVFTLEPGNYTVMTGALPAEYISCNMLALTAEETTGTLVLDFAPGTQTNPIWLTEEDSVVTNEGTMWYANRFSGTTMQITGKPGFTVQMGDQTLTDTDGVIELPVKTESPFAPMLMTLTGDGEYRVKFLYPAGHQMNPAQLVLGENTVLRQAGDSDYYYTWTAIADGKLTITMDASAQWVYCLSNATAGTFGDIHWSDDENLVVSETISVKEGDEISLTVNTYDKANMFENPAGSVVFDAAFTWIVDAIPFTTAQTPANGRYNYEITGAAGLVLVINDPDAYVMYGNTTFGADTTGRVIVPLNWEIPTLVTIGNCGKTAESYQVTFTYPVGHAMNPDKLMLGYTETPKLTGNYPYYYTWTAPGNGYLDFAIALAENWTYEITNLTTGDTYTGTKAEDHFRSSVSVAAGDELLLCLDTNGVACTVAFLTDFTWVVTEIPFTTIQLTADEAVSYEIHGAQDLVLTIEDSDAHVYYESKKFQADETGKVTVHLLNKGPALVTIGNGGTQTESYTVTFSYPLGHKENPDTLVLDNTDVDRREADEPYHYTWTAPGNGELHFAIFGGENWCYTIHNLTTGQTGTTYCSGDPVPQPETTVTVSTGDQLLLLVDTCETNGFVQFKADFTYVADTLPFTTVAIPSGAEVAYRITGVAEGTLIIEGADAHVVCEGMGYMSDANDLITIPMGKEDTVLLSIGNTGAAETSYHVSVTWPLGHARNPQIIDCREHTVTLPVQSHHTDGYYAQLTSAIMGTLTFSVPTAPAGVDYTLQLQVKGEDAVIYPAADGTMNVYVYPGEVVQLLLQTKPDTDGNYPAGDFDLNVQMLDDNAVQTITFDPNGGTLTGAPAGQTHKGRLEAMPADPVRPDYNFDGWFDAPEGGNPVTIDTVYKADGTIYAQWTKIEYQVRFDAQGGVLTGDETVTTTDRQLSSLPAVSREFYTFNGWFDAPTGGNKVDTAKIYTENTTLYAQWTKIEYQVSFDPQGGSLTGDTTVTTTDRQLSSLPAVSREFYSFNGWFDAPTGGSKVDTGKVYTENTTLYAQWTKIEYQVSFDPQGGSLTGDTTVTTTDRKLSSLPAVSRGYYTFNGWFDAPEGGNQVDTAKVYTENTTLYAQWTKIEYQVSFDPQGGSLTGDTTVTTTDRKLSSLPAVTRDGHTFNGWFDAPEGGNIVTTSKVYTGNTTLYAQWTLDYVPPQTMPYTVQVVDGNGRAVTSGVTVTWQGDNGIANKTISNASGSVTADLLPGTYKVILTLSGSWADYRYDELTVTESAPVATVQIVAPLASNAKLEDTYVGKFVKVSQGATYVQLNSSQPNYAVYDGTAYCFFYCPITAEGKYTFTTSNGAPISTWGTATFFLNKQASDENNVCTWEFKKSHLYSGLAVYFAVEVTGEHTSTILRIAKAGEAEYTYHDAPYKVYKGTQTPDVNIKDGKPVAIDKNIFHLTTGGKKLTYVDMVNDQYVKGEDGYYHLGTADGPILYVNLGENAPYRSLATLVGAVGQYGTGFKKIFFDDDNNPIKTTDPEYPYLKEDYTDAMVAYCLHMDPTLGVYPLTDDLIYMLQNGGDHLGWYKPEDDNYLFKENGLTVDLTLAWMFAVCYLK